MFTNNINTNNTAERQIHIQNIFVTIHGIIDRVKNSDLSKNVKISNPLFKEMTLYFKMLSIILNSNKYSNKYLKTMLFEMIQPTIEFIFIIIPVYFDIYKENRNFVNLIIVLYRFFGVLSNVYTYSQLDEIYNQIIEIILKFQSIDYELASIIYIFVLFYC